MGLKLDGLLQWHGAFIVQAAYGVSPNAAAAGNRFSGVEAHLSLCLGTQGEFALLARDYHVVVRVSGWYDRLQQSRLAGPGCPACALGWTPQAQGTCNCRLEACVARFYAARPALRVGTASVARSPPIGATFLGKGGLFWPSSFLRSVASRGSHGNSVAHRPQADILRNSYFRRQGVFLGQISCGSRLRCPHVAPR